MTAIAHPLRATGSLVLPVLALAGLLAYIATEVGWMSLPPSTTAQHPETTTVASRPFSYRVAGEFYRGAQQVDGPLVSVDAPAVLEVMTYQVTAADYGRCVDDGACRPADPKRRAPGDVPVTGVSYNDATTYATWLSARTGEAWRLPTVEEWVLAAGDRAVDPALEFDGDIADPAARWLALYEREIELGSNALAAPQPKGFFGFNKVGVADIGGTVWEWTSSCASRTTLDTNDHDITVLPSCGVRYLEGRHRTQMSAFVRDARSGGCSTGTPPDNLGFRLVRERAPLERLGDALARLFAA